MAEEHEVVIVGGGIAGLATALALKRVGIPSLVLERSHELRTTGAALSLFPNAWRALAALGVADKLTPIYHPFESARVANLVSGTEQKVTYNTRGGMGVRPVHRKILLETLAEELDPGTIRFSSKLASIKTEVLKGSSSSTVTTLHLEDGAVIRAKVLIGCDGVHSVVAQWLGLAAPIDSGRSAVRGLAFFPEGHGFNYEVRIFLEYGKRAGFVPLNDKEIYWFTTQNTTPREKEMTTGDPNLILKEVTEHLAKDFPSDYQQVVRHADLSTVSWAPLMFRVPWDLFSGRTHKGCVTAAGDALHPMTPDLGQGGGSALEDAVVLARNVAGARGADGRISPERMEKGIEEYVKERRWRVAGLTVGAFLSGFVQQGGTGRVSGWAVKLFRDHIFFRFVMPRILDAALYDCGVLPSVI